MRTIKIELTTHGGECVACGTTKSVKYRVVKSKHKYCNVCVIPVMTNVTEQPALF